VKRVNRRDLYIEPVLRSRALETGVSKCPLVNLGGTRRGHEPVERVGMLLVIIIFGFSGEDSSEQRLVSRAA
jgi:hypothetical protein